MKIQCRGCLKTTKEVGRLCKYSFTWFKTTAHQRLYLCSGCAVVWGKKRKKGKGVIEMEYCEHRKTFELFVTRCSGCGQEVSHAVSCRECGALRENVCHCKEKVCDQLSQLCDCQKLKEKIQALKDSGIEIDEEKQKELFHEVYG